MAAFWPPGLIPRERRVDVGLVVALREQGGAHHLALGVVAE
jgi:hypothetical protein